MVDINVQFEEVSADIDAEMEELNSVVSVGFAEQIGVSAVKSVNGMVGDVVLDYEDVGALPDSTVIPSKTSQLTNDSGFLTSHQSLSAYRKSADQDIIDATKLGDAPSDGKQYARQSGAWTEVSGNVTSVNGQTGVVVLDAEDVGALPEDTEIPTKTSQLVNDSGFLTEHQSLSAYRTSADQDVIDEGKADVSDIPTKTSQLTNDSGFLTEHQSLSAYRTSSAQDTIDSGKVDKVDGKGLSTNDYNDTEKGKVASALQPSDNVSDLTNDAGYLTLATLPIWDGSVI